MVDLLVDVAAYRTPQVLAAAVRQETYSRVCYVDDHLTALSHLLAGTKAKVLTTPDRVDLFAPAVLEGDEPLDVWCLRQRGVPKDKARAWVKKHPLAWDPMDRGAQSHVTAFNRSPYREEIRGAQALRDALLAGPLGELGWEESHAVEVGSAGRYRTVARVEDTPALPEPGVPIALDFETEGAYPLGLRAIGFSLSWEAGEAYYFPLRHTEGNNYPLPAALQLLARAVSRPGWVAHNARFEWHVLCNEGIDPSEIAPPHDTMFMAWHNGGAKGLKDASVELLGIPMTKFSDVAGDVEKFSDTPIDRATEYGAMDADICRRIFVQLTEGEPDWWDLYDDTDRALIPIIAEMERRGLRADVCGLRHWEADLADAVDLMRHQTLLAADMGWASQYPEVNLDSPPFLMWFLFEHLGLEPQEFRAKGYATDEDTLRKLAGLTPATDNLLNYREFSKLHGTYAIGLREKAEVFGDCRIHPQFDPSGTKTGRLSSKGPNGQNVPGVARRFILPDEGYLFASADYGQIELRILAQLSGDKAMMQTFAQGISPHQTTLEKVFGKLSKYDYPKEYTLSKNVNFGIPYGGGADMLVTKAREGGVELTKREAQDIINRHRSEYPRVWKWIDDTRKFVLAHGYIETLQGRRAYYPEVANPDPTMREAALREAVNAVIQGTAGYFGKEAMVEAHRQGLNLMLNIHDEIVIQARVDEAGTSAAKLAQIMIDTAQAYMPNVPVESEPVTGKTWKELK